MKIRGPMRHYWREEFAWLPTLLCDGSIVWLQPIVAWESWSGYFSHAEQKYAQLGYGGIGNGTPILRRNGRWGYQNNGDCGFFIEGNFESQHEAERTYLERYFILSDDGTCWHYKTGGAIAERLKT